MRSQFLYISSQVLFDGRAAQLNKFRFSARWPKYRSNSIQSFCGKNTKCFQTPWERIIILKRCWSFNSFFERIITPITIYDPFTVKLQTILGTRANSGRFHFKVGCISAFRENERIRDRRRTLWINNNNIAGLKEKSVIFFSRKSRRDDDRCRRNGRLFPSSRS